MERAIQTNRSFDVAMRTLCFVLSAVLCFIGSTEAQQVYDPFLSADIAAHNQATDPNSQVRLASAYAANNVVLDNGVYVDPNYSMSPSYTTSATGKCRYVVVFFLLS